MWTACSNTQHTRAINGQTSLCMRCCISMKLVPPMPKPPRPWTPPSPPKLNGVSFTLLGGGRGALCEATN